MILQLIKMQENMQYDISKAVDSVTWSGSVLNAGRSVEFALLNDPYDPGLKFPPFAQAIILHCLMAMNCFTDRFLTLSGQLRSVRSPIQLMIS